MGEKYQKFEKNLIFHEVDGKIYYVFGPGGPVYEIPPGQKEQIYGLISQGGKKATRTLLVLVFAPLLVFPLLLFIPGTLDSPFGYVWLILAALVMIFGLFRVIQGLWKNQQKIKKALEPFPSFPLTKMGKEISKAREKRMGAGPYVFLTAAGVGFLAFAAWVADSLAGDFFTPEALPPIVLGVAGLVMIGAGISGFIKKQK